jgi:uncharacterized protein with ATP-grasp and redox domains
MIKAGEAIMRPLPLCRPCLAGLARTAVSLSGHDDTLVDACLSIIDRGMAARVTPPAIANRVLRLISTVTGVVDPFASHKEAEFRHASEALSRLDVPEDPSLLAALTLSALGNANDHFITSPYGAEGVSLAADVDKIAEEIYNKGEQVLFLGDNVGDFLFDMPLARHLRHKGKEVMYAVKRGPAQNDLTLADVERFGLRNLLPRIISTGASEVGLRRRSIRGILRNLWESDAVVIAKGMGNYETMSEYENERPVIHVMKIKCQAVAAHTGFDRGAYVALKSGE